MHQNMHYALLKDSISDLLKCVAAACTHVGNTNAY